MLFCVSRLILVLVLLAVCWGQMCNDANTSPYENVAQIKSMKNGDLDHYYIGGLFGVHEIGESAYKCSDVVRPRGIVNLQAFLWSINEFKNKITDKGVDIGGVAFDNCGRKEQTIENVLSFAQCKLRPEGVKVRHLLAYVGPDRSSEALAIGRIMTDMNITYISHAATSPELSKSQDIPYFLRTVPSDANDAIIMARMLGAVSTKYTLLVYMDNDYGRAGMEKFKEEAERIGVCIVREIKLAENPTLDQIGDAVAQLVRYQATKYVALYADATHSKNLLQAINANTRVTNKLTFVGTSSWGASKNVIEGIHITVNNSIVIAPQVNVEYGSLLADFTNYWKNLKPNNQIQGIDNPWFNEYWEQKFQCTLQDNAPIAIKKCNLTQQSLDESDIDVYVPYVIMAVDAITDGIYRASNSECTGYNLCTSFMNNYNQGTQIYTAIKELKKGSRYVFDRSRNSNETFVTGDVSKEFSIYDIFNIVNGKHIPYGTYNPVTGEIDVINRLDSTYYRRGSCPDSPCLVCNEYPATRPPITTVPPSSVTNRTTTDPTDGGRRAMVYYPAMQEITGAYASQSRSEAEYMTRFDIGQKWIIALGVLAGLGIFAVFVFEIYVMYKLLGTQNSHKWRTVWLGQLLLFGIFLSYLTLFAYIPIPTKATCGITRFGVGISYAIMFAVLLVKLMVILTSKASESLLPGDVESPNYLRGIYQFLMFMFAVGVQVVIAIQWLITVPPEAIQVLDNRGEPYWICNHYTWSASAGWYNMPGFVRTEFENHVLSLIYIMVLIVITTILTLKSHGIITNNRESIFIGISAGFSIPIWLAWTLVGGLNRDHVFAQEFGDACIALGLFLTATLILFAMFLPKVRQLVNMGVEGIYFEDDRETVYNESVILAPPSYKSRPGSVIYVNNPGMYSDPVVIGNGDPSHNHLRYSTAGSVYSSPPGLYRKAESTIGPNSKVLRVTGDLTGKHPAERKRPQSQSDFGYGRRSEKGTISRARSHQNIGAL